MFGHGSWAGGRPGGGGPMRLIRRIVLLAFAGIQLVLVARILVDLGVIPTEGAIAEYVLPLSDALAAPVKGLGDGMGGLFGGGAIPGLGPVAGQGLNPAMLAALFGWTVVEGLVLRVVGKFAAAW
jgi:hypothetical protein